MKSTPGPLFAFALAAISLISPLAVHLFMPAIPAVRVALGLSSSLAQLTFSIALFGMAFATLFYGSLSDRYGRRPVLLSGLALFLAGSAISALATSVVPLVAGRLVQAIGAGCGITLGRAIAQDVYGPERLIKAIAYLTRAYTIGPMISPIVGGILIDAFGWRSVFGFALAFGAVIAVIAYLVVFESRPPSLATQARGSLLQNYASLFGRPRFTAFVLQSGFCTGAFLATATAASSLLKDVLHRPSTEFGIYFLMFPFGYLFGNFISSRVAGRVANETMVLAGSLQLVIVIAVQSALLLFGEISPLTLFVPGFFITMSQGLSLPYAQSGAMATNPKLAGTAAGIGVFVQNFLGAAFAQLYGLFADGTAVPLAEVTGLSAVCGLGAALVPFLMARKAKSEGA
jgi:DHA1 family bicyclomycin/chloramphenicol resistance-like MFS transporter